MKLLNNIFIFFGIVFILMMTLVSNVYAKDSNSGKFEFEQSTYMLRGDHDMIEVNLILPDGYTLKDIEITSEDNDIAHVLNFMDKYYIESLKVGETKMKAVIKSTDYVTYCNVKVEEPIIIDINKKEVGVSLEIDSYCPYLWFVDSTQAFEISVMPLNKLYINQGQDEEKWVRLGEGIYGEALNKKYSYDISENSIISMRWLSWANGEDYNKEYEIYRKTIIVDDIEPTLSIGANIKIYANDYHINNSTIHRGDTLQLSAMLVEIASDTPITWQSYQKNVAIVDQNGLVTALRNGTARIAATATIMTADGNTITYTDIYTIIVENYEIIAMQQLLEKNGTTFGVIPDEISGKEEKQAFICGEELDVSWISSDNNIATVDKNGTIQGISNGKVTISANIDWNNNKYCIEKTVNVTGIKEDKKAENNIENRTEIKINDVDKKDNSKENNNKNDVVKDDTIAKQVIPQTGDNTIIMIIGIISLILISTIIYIKYKNIK